MHVADDLGDKGEWIYLYWAVYKHKAVFESFARGMELAHTTITRWVQH